MRARVRVCIYVCTQPKLCILAACLYFLLKITQLFLFRFFIMESRVKVLGTQDHIFPRLSVLTAALDVKIVSRSQLTHNDRKSAGCIQEKLLSFVRGCNAWEDNTHLLIHLEPAESMTWIEYKTTFLRILRTLSQYKRTGHSFVLMPVVPHFLTVLYEHHNALTELFRQFTHYPNLHPIIIPPQYLTPHTLGQQRVYLQRRVMAELSSVLLNEMNPVKHIAPPTVGMLCNHMAEMQLHIYELSGMPPPSPGNKAIMHK